MRSALSVALVALAFAAPAGADAERRIVSVAAASLREAPGVSRRVVARLPLGSLVTERARTGGVQTIGGETAPWLKVTADSGAEGWVFGALTLPYAEGEKDAIALQIAAERLRRQGDPFEPLAELHAYLARTATAAGSPDARARLGLAALCALGRTAEAIGFRRIHDPDVATWAEANARDLVWNEPAARWIVVADRYWELHDRFATLPVADEIAWAGARAPLPGECEGDVPCSLSWLLRSDGRYLATHPRGTHASEALSKVAVSLDGVAEDPRRGALFSGTPPEELDRLRADIATLKEALAAIDDPRARGALSSADALLARAASAGGRK